MDDQNSTKKTTSVLTNSFIDSREATGPIVLSCYVLVVLLPLLIVDSNGLIVIDESSVCGTPNNHQELMQKQMIQAIIMLK